MTALFPGIDAVCHWMWINADDIPDDGSVHRHICGLPSDHDGEHECDLDAVTRADPQGHTGDQITVELIGQPGSINVQAGGTP